MKRAFAAIFLCFVWVCATPLAFAHLTGTSALHIELPQGDAAVQLRWEIAAQDLIWMVFIDRDFDGIATREEIAAARARYIEPAVLREIAVSREGAACGLKIQDVTLAERSGESFVSIALQGRCPRAGALAVGGSLFMGGSSAQRVLLNVKRGALQMAGVISAQSPSWSEPARVSAWNSLARFTGEGIWHVLVGYDHIAFLLLLLLPSVLRPVNGRWQGAERLPQVARDIVATITAFTVAHSITLALAATGAVHLATRPIEVAIAASIAVAGGINLLPGLSRLRLPVAFGFGFVHGFGFANALGGIDPGGTALLPLLAGFNLGVEIAQLAIVSLVLPLIYLARATRWYATGVMPLGSCALGAAGIVWMLQRL